jgi:DNA-directed RNA polymerase specialized sigma24 family protein
MEQLNERKSFHLQRFDEILVKLNKLEQELSPLLTSAQKEWVVRTRENMLVARKETGLQTSVYCVAQLFGHIVIQHNIRGYTYRRIAQALDISYQRVRQICIKETKRRDELQRKRALGVACPRPWET